MAIERAHYEGRPQALVKHTFLHQYLPALANKVCTAWDTFIYVDGFAGPWQAADEATFADTSFGIALKAMVDAQKFQRDRGRTVRMVAHLVEKDAGSFAKLSGLVDQFPTIEVHPYHGGFQSHLPAILTQLQHNAFCFSFIDPKGISLDLGLLKPLLARPSSEALINFMFDFVNRFVSHPNPEIVETMNALIPGTDWRPLLDIAKAQKASPSEREAIILGAFRAGLKTIGSFNYAPSLTVQKTLADRTYYHLVFGTRNSEGLSVFRDSQVKALQTQADIRSSEKSKAKTAKSGQNDLFGGADTVTLDPSAQEIKEGREGGIKYAIARINAQRSGILWAALWPEVLTRFTIKRSDLASAINEARKAQAIIAPNWPSKRHRKPSDDQLLMPA